MIILIIMAQTAQHDHQKLQQQLWINENHIHTTLNQLNEFHGNDNNY